MRQFVVVVTKKPTEYHDPVCYIVEAESGPDAKEVMRSHLLDLSHAPQYVYKVMAYAPPKGRVIGLAT